MNSIRSYLLHRLVGGTILVLACAGAGVYWLAARSLTRQFDRNLENRLQGLASVLFQRGERLSFEYSEELMPEYLSGANAAYFELWLEDGRLIERSESLEERDLVLDQSLGEGANSWSSPLPDGRMGRYHTKMVEVHHVYPEDGPERPTAARVRIVLAHGVEELTRAKRELLAACGGMCSLLIASIAFISWRTVDFALAPARRLASALDAIDVGRLPQRVDVGPLPREITPVADTTNLLLLRVDAALERERRTSADIAHELRTPISEIIATAEVALRGEHDRELAQSALRTVRDVGWRMARSVSSLLKLARLDAGAESFDRRPVDPGSVFESVANSLDALRRERGVTLSANVPRGSLIIADREALGIILSNLCGNAFQHAPPHSIVRVVFVRAGAEWRLEFENLATQLRPADLEHLTRPFWRKDCSRSDPNHFGLGLALSHALAQKCGWRLDFALQVDHFCAALVGSDSHAADQIPHAEAFGVDAQDERIALATPDTRV